MKIVFYREWSSLNLLFKHYLSIMLSGDTSELIKATEIDLCVFEWGNSEIVFSVLHQTYALSLELSLYAWDVIKWFMPYDCIGIEL